MANATLYLVGSNFEEYSISLVETMAKGVPFISTNVGNACILPGGVTVDSITDMHTKITFCGIIKRNVCDWVSWVSSLFKKIVEGIKL